MSKSMDDTTAGPLRRRRIFIIIIAIVFALGIGYLAGWVILPKGIRSAYQESNCKQALSRADTFARFYPLTRVAGELAESIRECAIYMLASSYADQAAWGDAYNVMDVYSDLYPDGKFAADIQERTAAALIGLAKEKITEQRYLEALRDIDLVQRKFGDANASTEVEALRSDLYLNWGANLRDAEDFAQAEVIFHEILQDAGSDNAETAQQELARTYLAWGLALQSQQKFAEAKLKFDSAEASDSDLVAESRSARMELFKEWGDHLFQQGDYANAMGRYESAAALAQETDPAAAKAIIATGYVHAAETLSSREDFIGALVLLDFAQANDATQEPLDKARADIYLAFSRSDGEQAKKAMKDAAAIVCIHQTNPSLPLYGLNEEDARVGVFGVDGELPTEIAATTPGSLHYIACVEEVASVIGTTQHTLYASSAGFRPYIFRRLKYTWSVTLRRADTGEEMIKADFEGSDPPPFPTTDWEIYTAAFNGSTQYFGQRPDFAEVVNWLVEVLK